MDRMIKIGFAVIVGVMWLVSTVLSATTTAPPIILLEKAVHFVTSSGDDVRVAEGIYQVEATDGWMKLLPLGVSRADAILLQSTDAGHSATLESVTALMIPGEDNDVQHLVLLLPDGTGRQALGSRSGIRPRATSLLSKSLIDSGYTKSQQLYQTPQLQLVTYPNPYGLYYGGPYPSWPPYLDPFFVSFSGCSNPGNNRTDEYFAGVVTINQPVGNTFQGILFMTKSIFNETGQINHGPYHNGTFQGSIASTGLITGTIQTISAHDASVGAFLNARGTFTGQVSGSGEQQAVTMAFKGQGYELDASCSFSGKVSGRRKSP